MDQKKYNELDDLRRRSGQITDEITDLVQSGEYDPQRLEELETRSLELKERFEDQLGDGDQPHPSDQ